MGTPAAVQAASQGVDPASSHRITQLEVQLAKAQHTTQRLQANAPGLPSVMSSHRSAEEPTTRGKAIQEQIDLLTAEVGPVENTVLPVAAPEVVEIPESIPASQDTIIFSPSGRPMLDRTSPVHRTPASTPRGSSRLPRHTAANHRKAQQHPPKAPKHRLQHDLQPRSCDRQHLPANQRPRPSKQGRYSTLPRSPQPGLPRTIPAFMRSGIARWFGGLKIPDKKKNEVRQYIEGVMRQFPSISKEQRSNLNRHAVTQGIAVRAVAKFADTPLMKLLSIITAMSE